MNKVNETTPRKEGGRGNTRFPVEEGSATFMWHVGKPRATNFTRRYSGVVKWKYSCGVSKVSGVPAK